MGICDALRVGHTASRSPKAAGGGAENREVIEAYLGEDIRGNLMNNKGTRNKAG